MIWAAAGVLNTMFGTSTSRKGHLIAWLTGAAGAGIGETSGIRRTAIAVLAPDLEDLSTVLEKSLNLFGDELYIKHAPMLQQEGT